MKQAGWIIGVVCLLATGCGELVEVPPAHVGKILTKSGYQKGLKSPSRFRLPYDFLNPPKLVLAEVSDHGIKEEMKVFMPKDNLNLTFDVRGTFSITSAEAEIESIFDRLVPSQGGAGATVRGIGFQQVYQTYAQQVVRKRSREVVAEYTIQQVLESRETISEKLLAAVRKDLKNTPISVSVFGLAEVQPPLVIINAQEAAKKREIEIQQAEADKLVKLTEADAALEVAKKQQQVDLTEAETQVLVNNKLAEGVTQAFVTQRALKVLEIMAASDNKIFLVPNEALTNPALLMGITNQAFNDPQGQSSR